MWSIAQREIVSFFSSAIGFLAIGGFHLMAVLFLWVFDTDYNLLDAGFADLTVFFTLAPALLLFLIPAVGMRSFSEEIKQGTLELLLTKPLGTWSLLMGKFWAVLIVFIITILPCLTYIWALEVLMEEGSALDAGSMLGGFVGLVLLSANFSALTMFASILAKNTVSAFLTALFLCFFQLYGWEQVALLFDDFWWYNFISSLGMEWHYLSISKGVLLMSDAVYFIVLTALFLVFTHRQLLKIKAL